MNRRIFFSLLATLGLAASAGAPAIARAELKVVATTPDLAAVAREIGGANVRVSAVALPTQDPHFVDPRPHLALELARADLLIAAGLELEAGWLPTLQTGSRNGNIQRGGRGYLECSRHVRVLETATGRVDRSQGDIHPGGNPHFMFDPRRAVQCARAIASKMASLDASHAQQYRDNAERFARSLDQARRRWEQQLAALRGAKVIAYHRSFVYLADWLGFEVVEHVEPRPGIPPNPRHVAHVLTAAREHRVRVILQEAYYPDTTARLIAERSGARLVTVPGGPDFRGGQTYARFMERLVASLAQAAR